MLPMGTIMAASMLIAVLFTSRLPGLKKLKELPNTIRYFVCGLIFIAGSWNVFWYALQHLTEFWGLAALLSGSLMIISALYIYNEIVLPTILQKIRPLTQLLLLACAILYSVTIYNL